MGESGLRAGCSLSAKFMLIGDGDDPRKAWLTPILPNPAKTWRDWGRGSGLLSPRRTWGKKILVGGSLGG